MDTPPVVFRILAASCLARARRRALLCLSRHSWPPGRWACSAARSHPPWQRAARQDARHCMCHAGAFCEDASISIVERRHRIISCGRPRGCSRSLQGGTCMHFTVVYLHRRIAREQAGQVVVVVCVGGFAGGGRGAAEEGRQPVAEDAGGRRRRGGPRRRPRACPCPCPCPWTWTCRRTATTSGKRVQCAATRGRNAARNNAAGGTRTHR